MKATLKDFNSPGVISVLELYTLDEAKRRLGWTDASLRSARRRGLTLIKCGKRKYLSGRDLMRFLNSQAELGSPT